MKATSAAACAGLAAWCSLGNLGLVGGGGVEARVGLLPPWWLLPVLMAAAFGVCRLLRLSASQVDPLFGSGVAILPWLPLPLPAAALLWTGPFVVAIWLAVVLGVFMATGRSFRSRWVTDPRRAPLTAAALALGLYGGSAWYLSPILPDGDAPHYLILAQSLTRDGDLRIENNHQRGDDLEYSLFAADPHYQRRGVDGAIYSIHAPGLPALIAPAFVLLGYPGVVAFLGLVAALGTALVWHIGYRTTLSPRAAWFGWACCALTTPFFFQATQVFPDGIAATFVLLGMLPLILSGSGDRNSELRLWLLSGASLAALPWLQTRLGIIAAMTALCLAFQVRTVRQLTAFLAAPIVSAAAYFGFFLAIYGTANPAAPYGDNTQTSLANLAYGFPGLLFDQQFGLIANAPVYGFILAGVIGGLARRRRWSVELLVVMVPYLIGVGMFRIWWGGTSSPVRLLAPLAFVLGVAGARIWHDIRVPATKAVGLMALVTSVLVTAVLLGPDRGRLLLNVRDGFALWLEWGNDLIDLPRGLPSLFRDAPLRAWIKAAIWAGSLLAGWLALREVSRRGHARRTSSDGALLSWPATWTVAISVMVAFTLVWRLDQVAPLTPAAAELGLLRGASRFRPLAYTFRDHRFQQSQAMLAGVSVRTDRQRRPVQPGFLLSVSNVPAGTYQVRAAASGPSTGTLVLRAGTTPIPIWTASLSGVQSQPVGAPLRLPVGVESLIVEGDDSARRTIADVELAPLPPAVAFDRAPAVTRGLAHRAVGYGPVQAYFMDDLAYPEPSGFWVAGGRAARVVLGLEEPASRIENAGPARQIFLRNVPVENTVSIEADGERQEIHLAPREETAIALPGGNRRRAVVLRIRSQHGVRPSQLDPGSADKRYLGCWVEIR